MKSRIYWKMKLIKPILFIFVTCNLLLCHVSDSHAQTPKKTIEIVMLHANTPTSIRAMSVVNDSVAWVGGSNGYVGNTTDGGQSWHWMNLSKEASMPGGQKPDFRSIAAFSSRKVIVANAGSPASIFLTLDAGEHWEKVYSNTDSAIFLDGMVFRNAKTGLVYGDPIRGRFVILKTKDGGKHWKMLPRARRPQARQGEASFAASNSAIAVLRHTKYVWIGTGGAASRVLFSKNFGNSWKAFNTPMLQGKNSAGIFSLAFINKKRGICVGGDYTADTVRLNNTIMTENNGKTWQKPIINPFGYRSCVIYYSPDTLFATGTSGTDISVNRGVTWQKLSAPGFNVIGKARNGNTVFLAGSHGRIARLLFSTRYAGKRP